MDRTWVEFLQAPDDAAHAVQIYVALDELAESVSAFVASGFAAGDPAVLISTTAHRDRFVEHLAEAGWAADKLEADGLLVTLDAGATLDELVDGETVPAEAFARIVGGVIDRVGERFPGRQIRAFGEMVDVLCRSGNTAAAGELEGLWNDLLRSRRVALLCGYELDLFDPHAQKGMLPGVCRAHTHVRPAHNVGRLDRAVGVALEDVLGRAQASMVYDLVAESEPDERTPLGQHVLMWISENMPSTSKRILAAARTNYELASASV
jgi:KaiC/GvpD/RAD55 family RecA-like ATPase